jgi:hypothetical protein
MMKRIDYITASGYLRNAAESALVAYWATEDDRAYHDRQMRATFMQAAELLGCADEIDVILQPKPSHPATQVAADDRTIEQDMEGGR